MNPTINEFKLLFNNDIKLFYNKDGITLSKLGETSLSLFEINGNLYIPKLFYIQEDKNDSLEELTSDDILKNILKSHANISSKRPRFRLELGFKAIDDVMNNIELSESFNLNKEEINEKETKETKENQSNLVSSSIQTDNETTKNIPFTMHKSTGTEVKMINNGVNPDNIQMEEKAVNSINVTMVDKEIETMKEKVVTTENKLTETDSKIKKEVKNERVIQFEDEEMNNELNKNFGSLNEVKFDINCSICNQEIVKFKFVCLICKDFNLCQVCEEFHKHPTIKFKSSQLSNKKDALMLLKTFENSDFPEINSKPCGIFSKIKNVFVNPYYYANLRLINSNNEENKIRVASKSWLSLILEVVNTGKDIINEDTLVLVRNYNDLNVNIPKLGYNLKYNELLDVELTIDTKEANNYNLEIFLYNKDFKIDHNVISLKVEVYDAKDEKEFDEGLLKDYRKLAGISFQKKVFLKQIHDEKISNKDCMEVFNIMERNKWNLNSAIEELTLDD